MTRETKIGLLVGLAFIIVIGILLSDHLTSTTEPASAPLAIVGSTSREGLTTIGRPSVPVTVEPPPAVAPRNPVVTVEEIREPANVNAVIKMAPPAAPHAPQQPIAQAVAPVAPVAPPASNDPLVQLAQRMPQELELIGQATQAAAVTPVATTAVAPVAADGFTEYTVKEGDSLSRIASRLMGSSKQANQDAIMRANPFMKGDPNRIIVGRTYRIPTAATVAPTQVAAVEPKKAPEPKAAAADTNTYWYRVKENDNLWKIAADQLGNGNAWTAIKELNKDVLKGSDAVHPNMRLRLPAKPLKEATASIRD